jgi:predicted cobalt transporter CbtA
MRTLTLILLGLVVIFVAAIIAAPKLENKPAMISKEPTTRFEVKTKKTNRETPVETEK